MTADKRNTTVVVVLVISMTLGAGLLLTLEPQRPKWGTAPALMAVNGQPIDVEMDFAPTPADAETRAEQPQSGTTVFVYPEGAQSIGEGAPVLVVVVGAGGSVLSDDHKRFLLGTLGAISRVAQPLRVHLSESLASPDPNLPEARDVLDLLLLKRFIEPPEPVNEQSSAARARA